MTRSALIVGAGTGISAAFARALARDGAKVMLAARSTDKLAGLAAEIGAAVSQCDASRAGEVAATFREADRVLGPLDVALYNASLRVRGPIADLDPADVQRALEVTAMGAFFVGREAARRMVPQGSGTILFTGASAGMKGFAQSAPFAMGKFAVRGLAQSMARELHPKGVHVVHIVIDGGVRDKSRGRVESGDAAPDSMLDPAEIAETYMHAIRQHRSAWSSEIEVRPWVERF